MLHAACVFLFAAHLRFLTACLMRVGLCALAMPRGITEPDREAANHHMHLLYSRLQHAVSAH